MYVVRFDRNGFDDLFIERDSTSRPAHGCQQLVIEPFTPAKPPAVLVKGYTRHEDQVQPVRWHGNAMAGGFADAELPVAQVFGDILNLAGDVAPGGGIEAGQGDSLACRD